MKGAGLMAVIETPKCVVCHKSTILEITREQYAKLVHPHGPNVQEIFPDWNASERELLISGTHSKCWDLIFTEADEDDEVIA